MSSADVMIKAMTDVVHRTGAVEFQIRYDDQRTPTVWTAVAGHHVDPDGHPAAGDPNHWTVGAGMWPDKALADLCDKLVDGGTCVHCGRPTGFDTHFGALPLEELICWLQWDPELEKFRRGCE